MDNSGDNSKWTMLISRGETAHFDYKAPMSWNKDTRGGLTEDIVAMANTLDGGTLLIGVAEADDKSPRIDGLSAEEASTYDVTKICDYISSLFQPAVQIRLERPSLNGKQLIAIIVQEFDTVPIICTGDGPVLQHQQNKRQFYAGNILIRTSAAKSEIIKTAEDMQSIIRRGVVKTSNSLLTDFRRILDGDTSPPSSIEIPHERELRKWDELEKTEEKRWKISHPNTGVFTVQMTPSAAIAKSYDHQALRALIQQSQSRNNADRLPWDSFDGDHNSIRNKLGHIEGVCDLEKYQEAWQLHDTGAFLFSRLIIYHDSKNLGRIIPFESVIYLVHLSLLFALRLFTNMSYSGNIHLRFSIRGIKNHRLGTYDEFISSVARGNHRSGEDVIPAEEQVSILDLRSSFRKIAIRIIRQFFTIFNFTPDDQTLNHRLDQLGQIS